MLRNSTYGWSLEPISRHFNEVLQGVPSLRNVESTSQRATLSPGARHSTSTTILSMACYLQVVLAGIGTRTGFQLIVKLHGNPILRYVKFFSLESVFFEL